jgi:hypothetical protein
MILAIGENFWDYVIVEGQKNGGFSGSLLLMGMAATYNFP